MASVLRAKVLSKKHHYAEVTCDLPLDSKTARLSPEAFHLPEKDRSLPLGEVASTSQSAAWWSPGASDHMVPIADLQFLRDAFEWGGGFGMLQFGWLGDIIHSTHDMIFRIKNAPTKNQWYFGLDHFDKSCAIAWPVELVAVPSSGGAKYLEFLQPEEVCLLSVFDHAQVEASTVVWKSWLRQYQEFSKPAARAALARPAVRAFVSDGPGPLLQVAAREAFWSMKSPWLLELAQHLHIDVANPGSLCSTVSSLVMSILDIDEEASIPILQKRLAVNDITSLYSHHVMTLDDALECMDVNDAKKVRDEQKATEQFVEARSTYACDYVQRKRRLDDSKLAGKKAKAKPKAKAIALKDKFGEGVIPQAEAKKWLPEGSHIWKDRVRGAWNAHHPPRARISEPYDGDERAALLCILRRVWQQHSELTGNSMASCPYTFD